jgi:hypothetical protein
VLHRNTAAALRKMPHSALAHAICAEIRFAGYRNLRRKSHGSSHTLRSASRDSAALRCSRSAGYRQVI